MTLEKRKRYLDIHPEEAVYEGEDSVVVHILNWSFWMMDYFVIKTDHSAGDEEETIMMVTY